MLVYIGTRTDIQKSKILLVKICFVTIFLHKFFEAARRVEIRLEGPFIEITFSIQRMLTDKLHKTVH